MIQQYKVIKAFPLVSLNEIFTYSEERNLYVGKFNVYHENAIKAHSEFFAPVEAPEFTLSELKLAYAYDPERIDFDEVLDIIKSARGYVPIETNIANDDLPF